MTFRSAEDLAPTTLRVGKAFEEAVQFADALDRGAIVNSQNGNDNHRELASSPPKREPRPAIPLRTNIADYNEAELAQLLMWLASDGLLRTDEQVIDEMVPALGFSRRGKRIENALQAAIARWRPRG